MDSELVRALRRYFTRLSDRIDKRFGGIVARIRSYFIVELMIRTVKEAAEDDLSHMAAGVAYYALFSIFPLLLGLIALSSFLVESDQVHVTLSDVTSDFLPGSEKFIEDNISAVVSLRGAIGLTSVLGMIWSGSAMFGAINRAINRAWDIHSDRPIYINKPRHLLMALSVGILLALSLASAATVQSTEEIAALGGPVLEPLLSGTTQILLRLTSIGLVIAMFLLIYKFMPNTKTYWKYIWPGAISSGLMFELSKDLFIFYLDRWGAYNTVYGSIAPVIVLLLWVYVSSLIILIGAEICSEYERMKNNVERGVLRHRRTRKRRQPKTPAPPPSAAS